MAKTYAEALVALYHSPHDTFVAERKRLSAELKASGDKAGATRLTKLGRPTVSAWAVNQLWWHARDAFDELLSTAERLREGDLAATGAHRDAIAKLRARAATLLAEAGHAATEATLRRVTTTLSAVAAAGGFDPDPPGALAGDREPPGFEAVGVAAELSEPAQAKKREHADEVRKLANLAAERRSEKERAKKQAERGRMESALLTARAELEARTREVERLRAQLAAAEVRAEQAREVVRDLEARLAEPERVED